MKKLLIGFSLLVAIALILLQVLEPAQITVAQSANDWQPPIAPASAQPPATRQPCNNTEPLGRAWFGDLHVHTSLSADARSRDMLGTVEDAYRFARGETIGLGPFDASGTGTRSLTLETPLDFAAVTDHAERMGEVMLCTTPGSAAYDAERCQQYRGELEDGGSRGLALMAIRQRHATLCGPNDAWCRDAIKQAWEYSQAMTEAYYDRSSDCTFTTFHGWEHSYAPSLSKVHRNVIFRNERVPELPVSALEAQGGPALWRALERLCPADSSACEAITIPHNPNVSNGRMFTLDYRNQPVDEQQRLATQRARYDALVEMVQIKGESECKPGLWQVFGNDEQCNFEKMRGLGETTPKDCQDSFEGGGMGGFGCQSRLDFARYALIEGRVEERRIGVNPLRFGMIGSTDTHNATPGATSETNYKGCCANTDTDATARLAKKRGFAGKSPAYRSPGGLMGVWAPENTRDALFDAMLRREVFATSGPRIQPRLFAGDEIPEDACEADVAAQGHAGGVPMGGTLKVSSLADSPVFLAAATADPNGGNLSLLQIIKIWDGEGDAFHQAVYDIAGDAAQDASVDLSTCRTDDNVGARQLCGTWRDPDFDPEQNATYYLRVLETPSCRWHWQQCLAIPEEEWPASCSDINLPRVIRERAWTSPVWLSHHKATL